MLYGLPANALLLDNVVARRLEDVRLYGKRPSRNCLSTYPDGTGVGTP